MKPTSLARRGALLEGSAKTRGNRSSFYFVARALLGLILAVLSLPALAGNCLVLGSSGDYASTIVGIGSVTNITLEAWVYPNDMPSRIERYITVGAEGAVIRMNGSSSPGQLQFYITTSGVVRSVSIDGAMTTGVWHHVTGTWDGTTMKLYLDGNLVASATPGGTLQNTYGSVVLSKNDGSEWLNAKLDDVRIWSTARTQTQILADMQIGKLQGTSPTTAARAGLILHFTTAHTSFLRTRPLLTTEPAEVAMH